MDNYRRQQIQAAAWQTLQEAGATELPISPIAIANQKGIQVIPRPSTIQGASGWLLKNGDQFAIVYATDLGSAGFERFSVGHELGHYVLDGHADKLFDGATEHVSRAGFRTNDPVEQEADYFSACLLMPKALCQPLISKSVDGLAAVLALAKQCDTSLVASAIRYAEIGQVPIAVVQSFNRTVEFCHSTELLKHVRGARLLSRGAKVPKDSATRRLADDIAAIHRADEDSDTAMASDWFSGTESRIGLVEEAIGLGRFGRVLTILTLDPEGREDNDSDDDEEERQRSAWNPTFHR